MFGEPFERWIEKWSRDPRIIEASKRPDFELRIGAAVQEVVKRCGSALLDDLLARAPEMRAEHAEVRTSFELTIRDYWGDALDLFEVLMVICREAGESVNTHYREQAARDGDHCFDVLTRLHARSCLVASEVFALLRSGHASGAHARWRTLHELAVVAYFISEHDDDTANRYLLHDSIQSYKAMLAYQEHCETLGHEPLSDEEVEESRARRDKLVATFGPDFCDDYGWAAEALGQPARTFRAIEDAVDLSHLRPYYKMASHAVHPNARGLLFDIGLSEGRNVMLAGPSTGGLADPGDQACISLFQTTVCLLNHKIDLDGVVVMCALQELLPRVGDLFLDAHEKHEAEAAARRESGGEPADYQELEGPEPLPLAIRTWWYRS